MALFMEFFLLLIFLSVVSYFDIKYGKIYNSINLAMLVVGFGYNAVVYGLNGIITAIVGFLVGILILLGPYFMGWVGGGDVKMLAVVGTFVGPMSILFSTLIGLVIFGVIAFVYLISKKRLKIFLIQLFATFVMRGYGEKSKIIEVTGRLPLGVALSAGVLIFWVFNNAKW